jgi:hypothetical protein
MHPVRILGDPSAMNVPAYTPSELNNALTYTSKAYSAYN